MLYLVDGHNLIGRMPGMRLDDFDDEQALIGMLQEFCRRGRHRLEVFFDKAPPGEARVRSFGGTVTAHFVRQETTADAEIRRHLAKLGRGARNWTVVSSDAAVQREARAAQAGVQSSDDFAKRLQHNVSELLSDAGSQPETKMSQDELDEWLDLFSKKR